MAANGARVHIYGDWDGTGVKKAQQDLGTFDKQAAGMSGSLSKSFMGIGAAMGGAFAIGSIVSSTVDFMRDAAAAAIEDEKSVVALAKAMDNLGLSSKNAMAEDFIKSLMLATGVADDQLRPAFQKLVTATGDVTKSQELLQLSLDISAATGKDLAAVSMAMAKASMGQVSALTRLGVPLDAGMVKAKDFAGAVEVLTEKFSGQAAAAAGTYGGQLKILGVAADEAKETIGYALLDALDAAGQSLGGPGGLSQMLTEAGDMTANFVTGVSSAIQPVLDFAAGIARLTGAAEGNPFQNLIDMVKWIPMVGQLPAMYDQLATSGAEVNAEQERLNKSLRASEALYAGYVAATDPAVRATMELADAEAEAKQKAQELKDMFLKLQGALSSSAAQDAFVASLRRIDDATAKNIKTFDGFGKAATSNKDLLRGLFSDAASQAETWQKETGASTEKTKAYFDGLAGVILNKFVKAGFKKKDVLAFLGGEGIWKPPIIQTVDTAGAAAKARAWANGKNIGTALTDGVTIGIMDGTPKVVHQSGLTIAAATAKANAAAGIESPSKVWAKMGVNLVEGLIVGMKSKDSDVAEKARETMQALSDKAAEILTKWDDKLSKLKDTLKSRKQELFDAAKDVSSSIMEGLNFGAANDMTTVGEDGKAVGMSFMDGLRAQAAQAIEFAAKVKELIAMNLSPAALQQVLAAGVTAGTEIAKELIAGGSTAITETNDLVSSAQGAADEVGLLAAQSWYGAGVAQAQANYDGFAANYGKGGPARNALENLMDRLASSLDRTITMTVKTVYEAAGLAGARAMGGSVAANKAYLVGEKGPEVLVMGGTGGTIIPNGGLPSARGSGGGGGSTYNITVNAAVGDPRAIGQQIVEYVTKFEKANGKVFAAA
jgi:hypothetical protein